MTEGIPDVWTTIDLPLLKGFAMVELSGTSWGGLNVGTAVSEAGLELSDEQRTAAILRLDRNGYLDVTSQRMASDAPFYIYVSALTERGLRQVGAYPSEDAYAVLMALIEKEENAQQDEVTKSCWQLLRQSLLELGKEATISFLAEFATRIPH